MEYVYLYKYLPELAEQETRTIMVIKPDEILPMGEYALIEMYCNTLGCDCRRVMFSVVSRLFMKQVAVVNYGWESRRFYIDWLGEDDKDIIDELKGPSLNTMSPQSEYAQHVLGVVKSVLREKSYVERLKRHYRLFKEVVDRNG